MTFEETQTVIKEFLEGNQNIIEHSMHIFLSGSIEIIYEDLKSLSKDGTFDNNPTVFQGVLDSLLSVSELILTAPMHNEFSKFLLAYSELIFNWNNNTYKDKTVYILAKIISSTVNSREIMLQAIYNMKLATDKLEVMRSWSPPAFDISLSYVDEQLKINEKESK